MAICYLCRAHLMAGRFGHDYNDISRVTVSPKHLGMNEECYLVV